MNDFFPPDIVYMLQLMSEYSKTFLIGGCAYMNKKKFSCVFHP
jgi:hypothetical protein